MADQAPEAMGVGELKAALNRLRVRHDHCVEKSESGFLTHFGSGFSSKMEPEEAVGYSAWILPQRFDISTSRYSRGRRNVQSSAPLRLRSLGNMPSALFATVMSLTFATIDSGSTGMSG